MKKYNFFILPVFCLFYFLTFVVPVHSQTARDEIALNRFLSAANFYAYPVPTVKQTPPPAGYKPFYISAYARHGSRYLVNADEYNKPFDILKEADKNGVLTEKGKQTLQVLDSLVRMASGRYGELTPLGARQHEGIAKRMFTNFPDVFKGPAEIDARSTIVIRCILSMMAECKQLLSMNPSLRIKNDASYHDMYYMNYEDSYFDSLRNNPIVQSKILEFERANTHPERLMKSLFNDEDYVKWKIDSFELMHSLFLLACNMQSLDTNLDLYSLFTDEECYDLWKAINFRWYTLYAASPITKGQVPFVESNLLKNILDTAESSIAKENNSATLRFGHEVCVLPLACLLEIDNCGLESYESEYLDKYWRNYNIFPMACNIQFVFFRKKASDEVLVKILLNEKEDKLPIKSSLAPYYKWTDIKTYYNKKLSSFRPK